MPWVAPILGIIPSFAWLVFYLHEDFRHPEPKVLVLLTFILGAISAVLVLPFQVVAHNIFVHYGILDLRAQVLLVLAGLEELGKFSVVFLFLRKSHSLTFEPVHPMVYMIISALGFAGLENIASLYHQDPATRMLLETTILRFVGATLLHTLSSGIVGYYWGKAFSEKSHFAAFIVFGLAIATLVHATFNYLVLQLGPLGFSILFLITVAFFVLHDFELLKRFENA